MNSYSYENARPNKLDQPGYEDWETLDTPSIGTSGHPLDSYDAEKRLSKLNEWWYEARISQAENRYEQAIDADFVDGLQWSEEDRQELVNRHQAPLVFNEIKPAVEWVCGTEKRTRVDWHVYPRTDDDREVSEAKTKLLKYIDDVNKAGFRRSRAFADAATVGIGWLEIGLRPDAEDEMIFVRNESWRNVWYDSMSVEPDLSDARYLNRSKVIDLDVAQTMFPERAEALRNASEALNRLPYLTEDDFFDSQLYYNPDGSPTVRVEDALGATHGRREVVRLIECWYRKPARVQIVRGVAQFDGQPYNPDDPDMFDSVESGHATLFDAIRMEIRMATFIDGGVMLQDIKSPYRHNRFPFVPVWGYRRGRDNMPYGIVRNSRDPQEDLNKRRSKALFLLSVNRTIMDKGAVDDLDFYEEESSRPDAIIEKNPGKQLDIETNVQLADEHILLGQQNSEYIRQASGVTGENLGLETNAASGKAILARQNQGTVVTATLFDNLRLAVQLSGEIVLSLVEQFYTEEKTIRLVGERGQQEFTTINEYDETEQSYLNDITSSQADFKVAEQDHRESIRMAMFEQMMDMIGKLDSNTAMQLLDLVFEFSDLPGKDEIVRRIRKLNGQPDPNSPDAEEDAERFEQQRAEEQRRQAEIALRQAMAEIQAKEAKAGRDTAEATQANIETMQKAIEAAILAVQAPAAAATADRMIDSAAADAIATAETNA